MRPREVGEDDDRPLGTDDARGRRLDASRARKLGRAFGQDFDDVVVRDDAESRGTLRSNGAPAATRGTHVLVDPQRLAGMHPLAQEAVWAHELAHVTQQRRGDGGVTGGVGAERAADAAALAVTGGLAGGPTVVPPQPAAGLGLQRCSDNVEEALDGSRSFTADLARDALDKYRSLSSDRRDRAVARYYPTGAYHRLLRALPPADASGSYADVTRDLLQRIQRHAARTHAAGLGLASQRAMAQAQATMMHQRNQAAAQAAHGRSVTPTQVAQEQGSQVAQTSIAPSSSALSPSQVAAWTTRAHAAVARIVAHATAHHPELRLTAADFHVDVAGIEDRGARVVAYGTVISGRHVCVVGRPFVRLVDADPAYAMSVVVHELHGHPDYGPYGAAGTEHGLELYDEAAALMPGYTQPSGADRTAEIDAYGYQETEIYSLLRSLRYHTAPTAAHSSVQPYSVDPTTTVRARVRLIKQQWTPAVAQSLLRGLYQRLRHDPRIDAAALTVFANAVRAVYTGAQASIATAVLL